MISSILFIILLIGGLGFFGWNVMKIRSNINLGIDVNRTDNKKERWKTMTLVALGQKKMFTRPIPAILHLFIYAAFVITQIELIEIFVDGIIGSHRMFAGSLGAFYTFIISFIEVLSLLALIATFAFLSRRNLIKVPRLVMSEMKGWPKMDANMILFMELVLVTCIFTMNGADEMMHIAETGESYGFTISSFVGPLFFDGLSIEALHTIERIGWWGHIISVSKYILFKFRSTREVYEYGFSDERSAINDGSER